MWRRSRRASRRRRSIDDAPVTYPLGRNGKTLEADNYDRKFRGPTTLQQAVEESINVVTVKLQERIGVDRTIRVARRVGISSPLNADLTLALGPRTCPSSS